jgi:hypothetical protein
VKYHFELKSDSPYLVREKNDSHPVSISVNEAETRRDIRHKLMKWASADTLMITEASLLCELSRKYSVSLIDTLSRLALVMLMNSAIIQPVEDINYESPTHSAHMNKVSLVEASLKAVEAKVLPSLFYCF